MIGGAAMELLLHGAHFCELFGSVHTFTEHVSTCFPTLQLLFGRLCN